MNADERKFLNHPMRIALFIGVYRRLSAS